MRGSRNDTGSYPGRSGCLELFDQRALLMLHDGQRQIGGDANVKRACVAAENVGVPEIHPERRSAFWP